MAERELLAALLQLGQRQQVRLGIRAQAAGVVVDHVLQARALGLDVQELVDLLLVLDHGEPRLRVIGDVGQLLLDRVLVERHRHAAEGLRGRHGPVELGPVVADDRRLVPAGEPEGSQPERDATGALEVLAPRVGLPDAEVLLADGDPVRPPLGVGADELRERVESGLDRGHRSSSSLHASLVGSRTENSRIAGGRASGESVRKATGRVKQIGRYDGDLRRAASTRRLDASRPRSRRLSRAAARAAAGRSTRRRRRRRDRASSAPGARGRSGA